MWSWFGELGVAVVALGGYASQDIVDRIRRDVELQGRPAILIYAGDHDASGEDMFRDLVERTDCWHAVHRVALTKDQVAQYNLPRNTGKENTEGDPSDSRAPEFMARHGYVENVQVEVDALAPDVLRGLYQNALDQYWSPSAYAAVLEGEDEHREVLEQVAQDALARFRHSRGT